MKTIKLFLLLTILTTQLPAQSIFNVTDFGTAATDYKQNTQAFQKAINKCCAAGGGMVYVPNGTFEIGRIFLKDNVTLYLEADAKITPAKEKDAFPVLEGDPNSNYKAGEGNGATRNRYSMIYAYRVKNIRIEGSGKIVGDGKAFWTAKKITGPFEKYKSCAPWHYYKANKFRPFPILLEQCQNVTIRDITIEDSSIYAAYFFGCDLVRCTNIIVRNDPAGPNTDGFHFSSSNNVHITDCDFVCGDDCIAIDSNYKGPAANYTITGCNFNTTVNVFRIFTGLGRKLPKDRPQGHVSDISASNCTVSDASGVFTINADHGTIERINFTNFAINMNHRGAAFFIQTKNAGTIKNILLSNMAIRTDGIGTITGEDNGNISNIMLNNLSYQAVPRTKIYGNILPDPIGYWQAHFAPYYLLIRHAEDISLNNIDINWQKPDFTDLHKVANGKPYFPAMDCQDVTGLQINQVRCSQFGSEGPAISFSDVKDAAITNCRAKAATKVFLKAAGNSSNITLSNNDLTKAEKKYHAAGNLTGEAVKLR